LKKEEKKPTTDDEWVYHIHPTPTVKQHKSFQVAYDAAILVACFRVRFKRSRISYK
jgi:hypothetical protein